MDISKIVPFINAICTVVSFILGFIIANYFHKQDVKTAKKQECFLDFYLPFVKMINYPYLLDNDMNFSELTEDEQNSIISFLISKDYLATKDIQHGIYSINKFRYCVISNEDKTLIDKEFANLFKAIIDEYRSLASELGYATIL